MILMPWGTALKVGDKTDVRMPNAVFATQRRPHLLCLIHGARFLDELYSLSLILGGTGFFKISLGDTFRGGGRAWRIQQQTFWLTG
jgi:hypothetical protein